MPDGDRRSRMPRPAKALMAWWRPIAGVLVAITLTAGGVTAWDQLRPYVTVEQGIAHAVQAQIMHKSQEVQIQQLAGRSCETEIKLLLSERRDIQRQLADARSEGNTSWERTMQEQLDEVNEDLAQAKRSCGLG